jgi:hypothetical protein
MDIFGLFPLRIGSDFINPKFSICFWRTGVFATFVLVPETAVLFRITYSK